MCTFVSIYVLRKVEHFPCVRIKNIFFSEAANVFLKVCTIGCQATARGHLNRTQIHRDTFPRTGPLKQDFQVSHQRDCGAKPVSEKLTQNPVVSFVTTYGRTRFDGLCVLMEGL